MIKGMYRRQRASMTEREDEIIRRLPDAVLLRRLRESADIKSEQTRRTYDASLRRAKTEVSKAAGRDVAYCTMILRPDETVQRLKAAEGWSSSTLMATINGLRALVKHGKLTSDLRAGGRFSRAAARWTEIAKGVEVKPETEAKEIMWTDVQAKTDEMEARARKLSTDPAASPKAAQAAWMDALLSSMYTDHDPRRQADYYRLYVLKAERDRKRAEEEAAYMDLTARGLREGGGVPTLHVKKFKTADAFGPWETALNTRTYELLKRSLEVQPRAYVFVGSNNKPFESANTFTKYHNGKLRAWHGEGVNLRALRHSAASANQGDANRTPAERARRAIAMGHSPSMNGMTYATGSKPRRGSDGTYEMLMTGDTGRLQRFKCVPVEDGTGA